ncbi:FG-GAP repeat protein [Streptomyces sp. enrichment culture]|uniref:FG-GAP repeat protein n=1 Tax=Streptomyces sp. enrichment culture TaxID=1795815 RepID=UPI003F556FC4
MGRWRVAAVLVAAGIVGASLVSAGPAAAVHGAVPEDFNGDGYRDAVLPAPGAHVAGAPYAGAVVVLYGSSSGYRASRHQTISQNSPGVPGTPEGWDRFGTATATADLNRDGYADLIVSAPYEDGTRDDNAGTVTVLWGGRSGLGGGTNLPAPAGRQHHGVDLAVVAAGPGARTQILVGGLSGTATYKGPFSRSGTVGSVVAAQDPGPLESVALGDLDRDGTTDEVGIGYRKADLTGGRVQVNPSGGRDWPEPLRQGDGLIAATGDVNGDGYADLVVGDPEDPRTPGVDGRLGGRVLLWRGSAGGIAPDARPEEITQSTEGVPGTSEAGDTFGAAVAVADLNRDGLGDLIVGAPWEDIGSVPHAGAVTVIPGRRSGPLGAGGYSFNQNTPGVPSSAEEYDSFGTTVSAADVDRDGRPELFVGSPIENTANGAVFVLPGGPSRPTGTGSRVFTADMFGLTQHDSVHLGGYGVLWILLRDPEIDHGD